MSAILRLQNELKTIQKNRKYGFYAQPRSNNFLIWDCQFYKDGYFYQLTMTFQKEYPAHPPNVHFKNEVFNPNVYKGGSICLDILSSKWQASMTIMDVLNGLNQLIDYPNPQSPANGEAANLYRKKKVEYDARVKEINDKNSTKYSVLNKIV